MSYSRLLTLACLTMSICLTVSQLPPRGWLPPDQDLIKCWSSVQSTEGCLIGIYTSFTSRKITLGPTCCKAITEINDKCWPKMFPFNPFFPPLLKNYCANKIGGAPALATIPTANIVTAKGVVESRVTSSGASVGKSLDTFGLEPKCLSALHGVEGCVQELITSFFSFQVRLLGPACCKAIITINDNCLPKIFPFNPFFPPLVNYYCPDFINIPPTPSKIPRKTLPN